LERLPPSCLEEFSCTELEKVAGDDPLLDVIVGLADDSDLSASELCPQLQKMCESEVWTYNEPSEYGELLRWKTFWRT
jgi:hypothetical protein